jgi:anti-anti-sigma factor
MFLGAVKALAANTRRTDGAIVLALQGDLDIASADRANVAIEEAERERPDVLVLDLSGLTFFDSTGLRLVIKAASRAKNEGRHMVVVPGPATHALVNTIQPDKLFEVADSSEAALANR